MMTSIYVVGNNTGRFRLRGVVDGPAMMAPTLWSWRVYGPSAVGLPGGVLTGDALQVWVNNLRAAGYVFRVVTNTP
jgi:hypothetical protein